MRTAKTDQTGWMPRLIRVFTGRKGHFVGLVMRRLISTKGSEVYKLTLNQLSNSHGMLNIRCYSRRINLHSWRYKFTVMIRQICLGNSADPDQTAPRAVWSGSTLFAIPSASFGLTTLWKSHIVQILEWLQQIFRVSEYLGNLRYLVKL